MVWSQVCGPTCSSCVLGSSGVSVAPFCRLSLWPHPLLLFSRLGFLPWAFVRTWIGRLRSCLGSYLILGELSFPCPGFRWAVPVVWLSRLLVISWNLYLGSFLSLPVFADGLGWFRLILGYPPSVAWQWRLLPWFFVRYLSACHSWGCSASGFLGPVVFLVFTLGHLSQVGSVFFLSQQL